MSNECELIIEDDEGYEITVHVAVSFTPAEPMTRDYPGCPAETTIESAMVRSFNDWISIEVTRKLEHRIIKQLELEAAISQCESVEHERHTKELER